MTKYNEVIAEKPFPNSGVTKALMDAWPSWIDARCQYMFLVSNKSATGLSLLRIPLTQLNINTVLWLWLSCYIIYHRVIDLIAG